MKILLYDIETSPLISYTWGIWLQNVIKVKKDWELLTVSWKWLGEKKIHGITRLDFKSEKAMVKAVWDLFEEADVIVAHNGNSFDQKKMNAKFVQFKLGPPAPYHQIDTKLVAKKVGKFSSNSMDKLCERLGLTRKIDLEGIDLWDNCMAGKKSAYATMLKYNKNDVKMLEELYLELRGWITNHPNVARDKRVCPKCAGKLKSHGIIRTKTSEYRGLKCQKCGGFSRERLAIKGDKPEVVN